MILLIVLLTVIFICISFIPTSLPDKVINPFFSYLSTELHTVGGHIRLVFLGFILLLILIYRSRHVDKKHPLHKKSGITLLHGFQITLVGFLVGYISLFIIAFIQLNILSIILNTHPNLIGITTDRNTLVKTLQSNDILPDIAVIDAGKEKELQAIAIAMTGNDSYYGKYILTAIPHFFMLPTRIPTAGMQLVANTLIISHVSEQDMKTISPVLGYLLVKQYFANREIKSYPKVALMDKNEYLSYRVTDANKKIDKLDNEIKQINGTISSLSASVKANQAAVNASESAVEKTSIVKNSTYRNCLAAGNSETECQNQISQFDTVIKTGTDGLDTLNKQVVANQDQLTTFQSYSDYFKSQEKIIRTLINNIPHELGVFEPTDSIKIVMDIKSQHAIADYLETLVHEYLHYSSYISDQQRLSDSFFEEGLTEYFARNIIKNDLHTDTNLGYPIQVKIISEMTNLIPESDFADIYFSKDDTELTQTLDRVYGENFYENNRLLFEQLQYTSSPKQAITLANQIMKKIQGTPLKENDLYSSHSNL